MTSEGNAGGIVPIMGTIVPNLGTTEGGASVSSVLLGETRGAVLGVLYLQPDQTFHVRQLIRLVGHGQGAVQRELRRLREAGLLLRTVQGRQVYYQANRQAAVFAELQGLLLKTVGLADVLRAALAPLASEVQVAFVYGSLASGRFGASSDVDLLLVGDASFREVVSALASTQEVLGREVNPSVYSAEDLQQRVAEGNHFLLSVLHESKIFILGGEDDLARLVAQRVVDRASQ